MRTVRRSFVAVAGRAARLDTVLKSYGMTVEQVNGFKPWFVSMLLAQNVMQRAHYESKYGVDMQLNARAHSANKTIVGLESARCRSACSTRSPVRAGEDGPREHRTGFVLAHPRENQGRVVDRRRRARWTIC